MLIIGLWSITLPVWMFIRQLVFHQDPLPNMLSLQLICWMAGPYVITACDSNTELTSTTEAVQLFNQRQERILCLHVYL